jgi:hypothetical protein
VVTPLPPIKSNITTGTIPIDWVDPRTTDRNLLPRVVCWIELDRVRTRVCNPPRSIRLHCATNILREW